MDETPEVTMENLPPKTLKTQLVRLDHNLKQIERSHYAGIQRAPGSLPILEAFQEFLDNERKKAKRKMIALSLSFILILLIASGAGIAIVTIQMKRMSVDYDTVAEQTNALKASLETARTSTQRELLALVSRIETESKTLEARHEQLLSASKSVETEVESGHSRATEMEAILDRLATENTTLKADLDQVMQEWPSLMRQVQEVASVKPGKRPSWQTEQPAAKAVAAVTTRSAPQLPSDTIALTIVPPGETVGIRWRLPAIQE
jgi:hypothetical protein